MIIEKKDIKKEIESLPYKLFKKKRIVVKYLKKKKESRKNINYFFKINNKEYLFRINIEGINKNSFKESKLEYHKIIFINNKIKNKDTYPKPIYFSKKGKFLPYSYIILSYIKGNKIKFNEKRLKQIIQEIVKINKVKLNIFDKFFLNKETYFDIMKSSKKKEEYIYYRVPIIGKLYKNIRKELLYKKPLNLNHTKCLVHGDLSLNNILIHKNKIKFIDLEYVKIGNPIIDLAKFSINKKFNKTYEKIILDEYNKKNKIKNIYESFYFFKDLQLYIWLINNTKKYLEEIFEFKKYNTKNHKKIIIKDIITNYNYLYKKKYIFRDYNLRYLKKHLKIEYNKI